MEEKRAALALVPPREPNLGVSGGLGINGFVEMERAAKMLAGARGIVPRAYQDNPAAVAAIIMTGFELGIAPMTAMRELHLIEGKVSLSATLMLTLARRAGIKTRWLVTDTTKATIGVTVPGQAEQTLTFSQVDAQAAGLWGKGNWSKHPAAMLRARATSAAIRAFCPEAIGGSVYESESGELTGGTPTAEIIEAQVTSQRPEQASRAQHTEVSFPPRKLSDCDAPESLKAWCEKYGEAAVAANKAEPILHRAEKLGVEFATVRGWLGLEEPRSAPEDGLSNEREDADDLPNH